MPGVIPKWQQELALPSSNPLPALHLQPKSRKMVCVSGTRRSDCPCRGITPLCNMSRGTLSVLRPRESATSDSFWFALFQRIHTHHQWFGLNYKSLAHILVLAHFPRSLEVGILPAPQGGCGGRGACVWVNFRERRRLLLCQNAPAPCNVRIIIV